ncbi:MAG: saccharopine dehydrogenase C-terminal domain-containing protein [Candidatus Korarchaeota archaeon]
MKVTILGSGLVGQAIAYRLAMSELFDTIVVTDISAENLRKVKNLLGESIKTIQANVLEKLEEIVQGSDCVSCALPGSISFNACKRVLNLGIPVIDSSYMPQDPFELDAIAKDKGVVYIPDAGFAPGISNIVVGYFAKNLRTLENVKIYVAGLPIEPRGPLRHMVNWSLSDFIDEYLRPARIVKDGKVLSVDPLSDLETVEIRGVKYEAFYTDGLRTLLRTIKARNMFEKTLRYPGHLERMRFLKEIGLLSDAEFELANIKIPAVKVLEAIFMKHIYDPNMRDLAIMYITADDGKHTSEAFLRQSYNESLGLSAMAITTGFTNAVLCEAVVEKVRETGTLPPELFGMRYIEYFKSRIEPHVKLEIRKKEQ